MTNDDDQLRRLFADLRFADEPTQIPPVDEDVQRARQSARKGRVTTWSAAALGVAVVASGVAVAVPNLGLGDDGQPLVADGSESADGDSDGNTTGTETLSEPAPATVEISTCPVGQVPEDPLADVDRLGHSFPVTRHCLLEAAVKHFDPERMHLPDLSTGVQGGGNDVSLLVGTKLAWTIPGEDGMGLVQVTVTAPGYADGEFDSDIADSIGCELDGACSYQTVPGTDEEVLVAGASPEQHLQFGVMYEREDGSFAGVAVYDLFGNNSLVTVSDVDITLAQAIAFVTDPVLQVDENEFAEARAAQESEYVQPVAPDYSSSDVVPAPAVRDMTGDEAQAALDACVETVPDWTDFQPDFGVWITSPSGVEEPLVIAERGHTKMECRDGGAGLFGTPEVKSSPYLRGPVSYNSMTFGRYVSDVDRVTVQPSSGPAYEAAMINGYWFLPEALENLMDPAIRGYDAAGARVYDSTTEDRDRCYTDPDGTEVVFYRGDDEPALDECLTALAWDH